MHRSTAMSIAVTCAAATMTSMVSAYPPGFAAPAGVDAAALQPSSPLVDAGLQLQAADFSAANVGLLSNLSAADLGSGANDVWGYVSPSGREYAIVGLQVGTAFVEVTNPTQPCLLTVIPDAASTWSDMATYQQYAYNVNENSGGIQVIDMTQIDGGVVELVRSITTGGLSSAHNIALNPQSGYAYPCGTNVAGGGFMAFDPQPPSAAEHKGNLAGKAVAHIARGGACIIVAHVHVMATSLSP